MMLKKSKGITWPLTFLALATTLVFMGGLASLQHNCGELTNLSQAAIAGRSAFGEQHTPSLDLRALLCAVHNN